jgi:phycocyanobilin lyase subunit alpha
MSSGSGELTLEQAIVNLQQTEDPSLRYYAAWWLGKFRVRVPEAIHALIAALEDEVDRTPDGGYPLRRNAARALGKLGQDNARSGTGDFQDAAANQDLEKYKDTIEQAQAQIVPALIACLDCSDYYVREAASQSLGELKDDRAVEFLRGLLVNGATDHEPAPGIPHLRQPYDSIIESLGEIGSTPAIDSIQPFCDHPVPRIRYAAYRALYQLTGETHYGDQLVAALQEPELQLRRSILMDLGACGYLEAVEAIARTPAENSLKLVALRGILAQELEKHPPEGSYSGTVSAAAIRVMTVMDSLL